MLSARPPGSLSLRLQPRVDELRGLSEHTRAESERELGDARHPTHISCEVKHGRLALTQVPHHLQARDRRIGRLQCLEATHWTDQLLDVAARNDDRLDARFMAISGAD